MVLGSKFRREHRCLVNSEHSIRGLSIELPIKNLAFTNFGYPTLSKATFARVELEDERGLQMKLF